MSNTENPLELFAAWFAEAAAKETADHTAMVLATAVNGQPAARVVLLKGFDELGFIFYTNLTSRKAIELQKNPQAALCFFWPTIDKQIRIEGAVDLVSAEEADRYFASRPRGSQIGAWASHQSRPLHDFKELQKRILEFENKFKDAAVPRPPFWSGYCLCPVRIEFWQRGEFRLHQRTLYVKNERNVWEKSFLYP